MKDSLALACDPTWVDSWKFEVLRNGRVETFIWSLHCAVLCCLGKFVFVVLECSYVFRQRRNIKPTLKDILSGPWIYIYTIDYFIYSVCNYTPGEEGVGEEGPHFLPSSFCTAPINSAASSQCCAIVRSLSVRPRGWCVVQWISTEPILCFFIKLYLVRIVFILFESGTHDCDGWVVFLGCALRCDDVDEALLFSLY